MKYTYLNILVIIFSLSSCVSNGGGNEKNLDILSKKDSLWFKRNQFLSHPIFLNDVYQDSIGTIYHGLWRSVKIENNRTGKVEIPENRDRFIGDSKYYWMDYPCNTQGYYTDIHFRGDSVFFSTEDRVYIEKKRIEFRGDTLVIFGTNKWDEAEFFIKVEHDQKTISELKKKGFNSKCLNGVWKLHGITDGRSDSWVIDEKILPHIPREFNFKEDSISFNGQNLIFSSDTIVSLEILQYNRGYSAEDGFLETLWLMEHYEINGIQYHYDYIKVSE